MKMRQIVIDGKTYDAPEHVLQRIEAMTTTMYELRGLIREMFDEIKAGGKQND